MMELTWGRRYLMTRPEHFRVEYSINPWMNLEDPVEPARAQQQWCGLVETLTTVGADVEIVDPHSDAPDMVYAMNLGLATTSRDDRRMVVSHMRYDERRAEASSTRSWCSARGLRTLSVGAEGVGPYFEAGDAFPYGDTLVVGYGPRTSDDALKPLAAELDACVLGLAITDERFYHLDLSFCPLSDRHALVYPAAFEPSSAAALLDLVPEPLVLTQDEAMTFTANSVVVGRTVVMPACPPRVRAALQSWGFDVVLVDVSEFHKGGGSIRCLTNPLDIDLSAAAVPGGKVLRPSP